MSSSLDLDRVTAALGAVAWAQSHLPALIACEDDTQLLGLLIGIARERTGAPLGYAVSWTGDIAAGRASFEAVATSGGVALPAPGEVSRTVLGWVAREGRPAWSDEAAADERFAQSRSVVVHELRSVGCVPIGPRGALYIADPRAPGRFGPAERLALPALCALAAPFLGRRAAAPRPVEPLPGLVGGSAAMAGLSRAVRAFAPMPWPALILGQTGTGKESVARAIHALSARAAGPFVAVNCATIPDETAEALLFGHERGAFTGADRRREGLVERAAGGTLFLDEVGELSPRVQPKVLRFLQEGTFERVGGERELRADTRIVAATHRALGDAEGGFRADLYHRLAACVIRVPALSERPDDVPALAEHLLARACAQIPGSPALALSPGALAALAGRRWPGNVRELENAVRGAVARCLAEGATVVRPAHLGVEGAEPGAAPPGGRHDPWPAARPPMSAPAPLAGETFEAQSHVGDESDSGPAVAVGDGAAESLADATDRFVRGRVEAALARAGGNRSRAAESLGVSRQWLHKLMSRWEQ